jgi:hypothetical protein
MTKKDYELLAKSIGWTIEHNSRNNQFNTDILYYYTGVITEMLQAQNPKFDKGLFMDKVQFHSTTN